MLKINYLENNCNCNNCNATRFSNVQEKPNSVNQIKSVNILRE
jgi:hypothetical protein